MNLTRTTEHDGNVNMSVFLDMPYLVDADYIKDFMARYGLDTIGLSHLVKVRPEKIDKWLSGEKRVNATAATLMQLIDQLPRMAQEYHEQATKDKDVVFRIEIP